MQLNGNRQFIIPIDMKKTIHVNIGGMPFVLDEDAYDVLKRYLSEIEIRLDGVDDQETMQDIEIRIADIFNGASSAQSQVVDAALVKRAIAIIGSAGFTGAAARRSSAAYAAVSPSTRKSILRWSGSLWRCSSFSESA